MSSLIETLRAACLERGASGIHGIGRTFRVIDDNRSRTLDREELKNGLSDFGVTMTSAEVNQLFNELDKDKSGLISFDEFLQALRPPMSKTRLDMIDCAFCKMDKTGDGVVTVEDLKLAYNVSQHPKFLSGEKTEDELLKKFLDVFQPVGDADDKVTKEEFINYYSGVSASIDDDQYFVVMMKNAWKL